MAYTTINKSTAHFNTITWTGNDASPRAMTGVGFQPDLCWSKTRGSTKSHQLIDSVRGVTKTISTNTDGAEGSSYGNGFLQSFDSDGFTSVTGSSETSNWNGNGLTYVGWNWKAGGSTSSNTDGSITSTVSANTTAGFSIVKYVGNSTAGATVGHGLGVVPQLILFKRLSASNAWITGDMVNSFTKIMFLNTTAASTTDSNAFNDTNPTSSVFTLGSALGTGTNYSGDDYIAYCFANINGYQRVGGYTGNGNADGTFIYTGFKPKFLILKRTDGTDWWGMYDAVRNPSNVVGERIYTNTNDAGADVTNVDFLSNGFKLRVTDGAINGSGGSYIYYAVGQSLVGSNNIPCTAR